MSNPRVRKVADRIQVIVAQMLSVGSRTRGSAS